MINNKNNSEYQIKNHCFVYKLILWGLTITDFLGFFIATPYKHKFSPAFATF